MVKRKRAAGDAVRGWRARLADRLLPPPAPGEAEHQPELDGFAQLIEVGKLDVEQFISLLETLHMLGTAGAGVEISSLSTPVLVGVVQKASKEQLAALAEHEELRGVFLHELFRRMADQLIPAKAHGVDVVVSWRFPRPGEDEAYDRYQLAIAEEHCVTGPDLGLTPDTTITIAVDDFIRLAAGVTAAATMFVTGKIKVKGEYGTAARLLGYFDLPQSA